MRQGFTLLEILIVFSVLAIASVNMVNSFGRSQERVEFQQSANEISSTIAAARASAISDDSDPNATRVTHIEIVRESREGPARSTIKSFIDSNGSKVHEAGEKIIKESSFQDIVDIRKVVVYGERDSAFGTSSISFFFDPTTNACDFSVREGGYINEADDMVVLYLGRSGASEINRYLYLHKKSCIPELLSTEPPTL